MASTLIGPKHKNLTLSRANVSIERNISPMMRLAVTLPVLAGNKPTDLAVYIAASAFAAGEDASGMMADVVAHIAFSGDATVGAGEVGLNAIDVERRVRALNNGELLTLQRALEHERRQRGW